MVCKRLVDVVIYVVDVDVVDDFVVVVVVVFALAIVFLFLHLSPRQGYRYHGRCGQNQPRQMMATELHTRKRMWVGSCARLQAKSMFDVMRTDLVPN